MAAPRKSRRSRTLFDADTTRRIEKDIPLFTGLHMLADSEDGRYPLHEAAIFAHVAEHEVALYEPRGWMCGPLMVRIGKGRCTDLSKLKHPWRVPAYVERDALSFCDCSATGVLLVESDPVFMNLFGRQIAQKLNLLLVTGCGIPRLAVRRLLFRLSTELGLPVYLLTDSSTWGYFAFSVLKRGLLAPHARFEYAAIRDLRFLGMRRDDRRHLARRAASAAVENRLEPAATIHEAVSVF